MTADTKKTTLQKEPWHLDKRVPVAFIFALFLQLSGFIWYAAKMDARLYNLENKQESFDAWKNGIQNSYAEMAQTLARLDERMIATQSILIDIKQELKKR